MIRVPFPFLIVASTLFALASLSHAQDSWVAYEAGDVTGNCSGSTVHLCLPEGNFVPGGDPVCFDFRSQLRVTFPYLRDVDSGCTMRGKVLLPPSQDLGDGTWYVCAAGCPDTYLRYMITGYDSDNPELDCSGPPGSSGFGVDDDGDGTIDEEWPNGVDDDGDGAIDEDLACEIALVQQVAVPVEAITWSSIKVRY